MQVVEVSYSNSKTSSHAVEVIWMCPHSHDFGNDCFVCPLNSKNFRELLQIVRGCFSDGEDCVTEPSHTECS